MAFARFAFWVLQIHCGGDYGTLGGLRRENIYKSCLFALHLVQVRDIEPNEELLS